MARATGTARAPAEAELETPKAPARSPHYRRAQRDRGAETRERLIDAALDVFGRLGFEGATTRQIAKEADVNLAAIVYHFGSKEALHLAVAEALVARISALVGPVLASADSPEATRSPETARAALALVLTTYADVILGADEAEKWARFIVREQMQPTAAFESIYRVMGGSHGIGARLVATILKRNPEDDEVKLRVFALIGQVLVFRVAQALVLRRMGWTAIGKGEREEIKRIVVANTMAILDAEVSV